GEELGIIEKSGAWYSYDGKKLGQGKEKVRDLLKNDPALCEEIEGKIRSMKGIHLKCCESTDDEAPEMPEDMADDVPPVDDVEL
ncbi:MAG: recombinase RecA, partial [Sutterella sp.]|nr:recombinase RecA [Sutterella sp.]